MSARAGAGDARSSLGIEIAGRPCAGKTTLASGLVRVLRESGVGCNLIEEAWPRFPEPDWKLRWEFSAWTLAQTVSSIIKHAAVSRDPIVVADKGLMDVQCWIEWFRMQGTLDESTAGTLCEFARRPAWLDRIDLVLVLDASYDVAVARHPGTGRIVNANTFQQLAVAYSRVFAEGPMPVAMLTTDDVSPRDTLDWAIDVVRRYRADRAIEPTVP